MTNRFPDFSLVCASTLFTFWDGAGEISDVGNTGDYPKYSTWGERLRQRGQSGMAWGEVLGMRVARGDRMGNGDGALVSMTTQVSYICFDLL